MTARVWRRVSTERWRWLGQTVCLGFAIGFAVGTMFWAVVGLVNPVDANVYRAAAELELAGLSPYAASPATGGTYRYAPWFALTFVPFLALPKVIGDVAWVVLMEVGAVLALWPLARRARSSHAALVLLLLIAPLVVGMPTSPTGWVLAALVWGLPSRWAGLCVGVVASLKVTPLLFCAVFIAQRRWWQAAAAVVVAAVLWAPVLLIGLPSVPELQSGARAFIEPVWLVVAGLSAATTLVLAGRRSGWTPAAAAVAAVLVSPRLFMYDATILLASVDGLPRRTVDRQVRGLPEPAKTDDAVLAPGTPPVGESGVLVPVPIAPELVAAPPPASGQ